MSYIGNLPTNVAFVTDSFNGDGTTTAFTMSVAPASTSSILVAVTGVLQSPSTYSVSGTTLTFSAAPPSGTGNISVRYLGIPASGVTTTAYRTVTEFTATAGQTSFSVPSYTVGYIDVYRNGSRLGAADFTATNGTTVVLVNACNAGDLVVTESFYVSSVLNAIPATAGAVNSTYIATGAVGSTQIANGAVGSTQIANGAVGSTQIAAGAVTPAKLSQPLTLGTAQNSTSGTSIDFTSIPSWVKRITVMFSGVSTSGTSNYQVQLGTGGVATTSGYTIYASTFGLSSVSSGAYTSGYVVRISRTTEVASGMFTFCNISGNIWTGNYFVSDNTNGESFIGGGNITLSGTLNLVRITTVNGTDTFDAGSINILYE